MQKDDPRYDMIARSGNQNVVLETIARTLLRIFSTGWLLQRIRIWAGKSCIYKLHEQEQFLRNNHLGLTHSSHRL
jgi:hypothetical protein